MDTHDKKGVRVTEKAISHHSDRRTDAAERDAREYAEAKLEAGGSDASSISDPDWRPGYTNRFPWLGFGSLVFIILCAVGSVITLSLADGKSQSHWPKAIAPNVIVNVLNNAANLAFGIAISNGIAIAWWRKTLQGSTIEQLNRSWKFSSSIKDVVFGAKYFNVIALAAITAKFTIIDGALLQESFSTEILPDRATDVSLRGYINETIPVTGRMAGRQPVPSLLAKNFNDDMKIWLQGGGLLPNLFDGCDGLCYFNLPGAGFEIDCSAPFETDVDFGATSLAASAIVNSDNCTTQALNENLQPAGANSTLCRQAQADYTSEVFGLRFDLVYLNEPYPWINMSIVTTNATMNDAGTCPGKKIVQSCKLRSAVVNYPVKIENYKDAHSIRSMALGVDGTTEDNSTFHQYNITLKQQNGFSILRYNDASEPFAATTGTLQDTRTRLGGVTLGLNTYLGGSASMFWTGANFRLDPVNNAAVYLHNDLGTQEGKLQNSMDCGYQFVNPMDMQHFTTLDQWDPEESYDVPSLVGKINQIMFGLALDVSNEDDDKDVAGGTRNHTAVYYKDAIHYKVDHRFMWGAFACTMFCILCIIPVYWGYWQLGRNVTLGPFEIAAAFRAPNLHHSTNKPIDELIQEVGHRQVKFGAITAGGDAGKIAVAEPDIVSRIHPAATPAGLKRFSVRHGSMRSPKV